MTIKQTKINNRLDGLDSQLAEKANNNIAQLYKLTTDVGFRNYLTSSFDILTLESGFYETSITPTNAPLPTPAFISINVTTNTSGTGTRKQIFVNYNYDKRLFIGNMHTGGKFMGWEEIEYRNKTQLFYENTKKDLYDLIVKRQNEYTKSFSFITDTHYIKGSLGGYGVSGLNHIKNFVDFITEGLIDIGIHGGDIVNGKNPIETHKIELKECVDVFKKCNYPIAICKGNHDYGVWYNSNITSPKLANVLSQNEWFSRVNKPFINEFVVDVANPTGGYFYKDFNDVKLRVIFINTADIPYLENSDGSPKYNSIETHGIGGKQMKWLAEKALNFSEVGWKVITFSHVSFFGSGLNSATINGTNLSILLKKLNNNESFSISGNTLDYEFATSGTFNKSAKHLCHIGGHYHRNEFYTNKDGIKFLNVIHSACVDLASGLTSDTSIREMGTITEDSWNVMTIDTQTNKLYVDKFGSGYSDVIQL